MPDSLAHIIDGKPYRDNTDELVEVLDPATGSILKYVPMGSERVIDEAVRSSRSASNSWAQSTLSQRQQIFFAFRQILLTRIDLIAEVVTAEGGKTLSDARGEVRRGLEVVEYVCGLPHLLQGSRSQNVSSNVDVASTKYPLGTVMGVTPFNFPAMVPLWMFPVAIAAGNSFILKPSERVPTASTLLAEWMSEAGLPDGVLNVVHGGASTVKGLLEHRDIAAASFVGSTPVAQQIYQLGTSAGKRVQALGGAKNHLVVTESADPQEAADAVVSSAFGASGQRCMAISVVVLVAGGPPGLVERICARADNLSLGPGAEDPDMGPMISRSSRDRALEVIGSALKDGAEIAFDGRAAAEMQGNYLGPCVVDHVVPSMEVYQAEVFGPVLSIVRVDTLDEAIDLVTDSPFGNGASIFTSSGWEAREFETKAEVGMVGVNVPIPVPMTYYSFGGWKESLFGDLGVYGPAGLSFYTRTKTTTSRWRADRGLQLNFGADR